MLNETKAGIEKEIKQTRLTINGYLDKLEKELITKFFVGCNYAFSAA
jgi:hypothetical protein